MASDLSGYAEKKALGKHCSCFVENVIAINVKEVIWYFVCSWSPVIQTRRADVLWLVCSRFTRGAAARALAVALRRQLLSGLSLLKSWLLQE